MYEGERDLLLSAGQTLLLWPGRRHGGTRDYAPELRFYWLHFALMAASGESLAIPQQRTVHRPDRLSELFRTFLAEQETGGMSPLSADLLLLLMLAEVARAEHAVDAVRGAAALLAQRAHAYLLLHAAQPISTADIARALDCNPDYLGRIYAQVYGATLTEAIHHRRLHQARQFLLDSDLTVAQIAAACGFSDPGYFRRLFRRHCDMTPLAYRRRYARQHLNSE
jgi:AraC-like DNA-binding protein